MIGLRASACSTAVVVFFITGCQPSPVVDNLHTYQNRIFNILKTDSAPTEINATLQFPEPADLRVDIAETAIQLRQFYALGHCPVKTLIAQRNTALGKIQLPSKRYIYEVQLIEGLKNCLTKTEDEKQREQLTDWLSQKQVALPLVWLDVVQNSKQFRATMSNNQRMLGTDELKRDDLNDYLDALRLVITLLDNQNVSGKQLETALHKLQQTPIIAKLWRSQFAIETVLRDTTKHLVSQSSRLDCSDGKSKQQVEFLSNVFRLYFVESIQPLGSKVNHYHYELQPILQRLVDHPLVAPELKSYISLHLTKFRDYQTVMTEHVRWWQATFKKCAISPQHV